MLQQQSVEPEELNDSSARTQVRTCMPPWSEHEEQTFVYICTIRITTWQSQHVAFN